MTTNKARGRFCERGCSTEQCVAAGTRARLDGFLDPVVVLWHNPAKLSSEDIIH